MAILCREHDLLYIRVPATGSSVVAVALQNQLGGAGAPASRPAQRLDGRARETLNRSGAVRARRVVPGGD